MKQEMFKTKDEAMKLAKEWAKTKEYVVVVESRNEFFVENEPTLIRIWEQIIWRHEK
ncbi:hypothetical protein HY448_01645 [Candidatus Pacearchaeota archaeon]|nr:hypothetical protein [Candidatus Pacearchaeota archaeon]